MGATINQQFSDNPGHNDIRLVTGSATAVQFPDMPLLMVRFKAYSGNAGSFFLGENSANMYWELDAGDDTGWVALQNLNHLWYSNASGTSDYMAIWVQK